MDKITEIYYALTGTPYIKQFLCAKGTVIKVKSYKMSEKIINEYGEFQTPKIDSLLWRKNCYWLFNQIDDVTACKLTKKSLKQKMSLYADKIMRKDIKPDLNNGVECDEFIITGISPRELQAYLESNSMIAALKGKDGFSDLFSTKNIIAIIIVCAVGYLGYKMILGGGL